MPRPILHVHIVDDLTGVVLADVDAASTADGLAYFLSSRHIDDDATEISVAAAADVATDFDPIVFEQRHPISRVIERALVARVESSPAGEGGSVRFLLVVLVFALAVLAVVLYAHRGRSSSAIAAKVGPTTAVTPTSPPASPAPPAAAAAAPSAPHAAPGNVATSPPRIAPTTVAPPARTAAPPVKKVVPTTAPPPTTVRPTPTTTAPKPKATCSVSVAPVEARGSSQTAQILWTGVDASKVNLTVHADGWRTVSVNGPGPAIAYSVPTDAPAGTSYRATATVYDAQRTPVASCSSGFVTS